MQCIASTIAGAPLRASVRRSVRSLPARRVAVVRAFVDGEKDVKQTTDDVAAALTNTATEIVDKVAAYWEASEEKPTIVAVGFASLLAIYFADTVVGAVDRLPLVSTTFELIGLSFTAWTAYRYFLVDGEKAKMTAEVKSFAAKVGVEL